MDEEKVASALSTVIEMAHYRQLNWQEAADMGSEVDAFELLPAIMESSPQERRNLASLLQREIEIVHEHEALFRAAPKLLTAAIAMVNGIPSEYDDKHTKGLLKRLQDAIGESGAT